MPGSSRGDSSTSAYPFAGAGCRKLLPCRAHGGASRAPRQRSGDPRHDDGRYPGDDRKGPAALRQGGELRRTPADERAKKSIGLSRERRQRSAVPVGGSRDRTPGYVASALPETIAAGPPRRGKGRPCPDTCGTRRVRAFIHGRKPACGQGRLRAAGSGEPAR